MTTLRDTTETALDTDAEDTEPTAEDAALQADSAPSEIGEASDGAPERRQINWKRVLAFGVLPGLALMLALASGYLRWADGSADDLAQARAEVTRIAGEDTVALLSYKPDSVDKDLGAARERLTGDFKDAYTTLTREVVIPGAKEKHITAVAKVTAAGPVSATASHAVVLLFVNQTVTIGDGAPTDTQPVIRTTLDKVNGHWLVSRFDPV